MDVGDNTNIGSGTTPYSEFRNNFSEFHFEYNFSALTFVSSSHSFPHGIESIYKEAWRDRLFEALATMPTHRQRC